VNAFDWYVEVEHDIRRVRATLKQFVLIVRSIFLRSYRFSFSCKENYARESHIVQPLSNIRTFHHLISKDGDRTGVQNDQL
jgi:hypothetical protein